MMTNEGCTPTPQDGLDATALYFTKAPGEDFYKVYARYANNPSWVPLHMAQDIKPDLQQVRDADRNISLDSGSYDDAHFYLRSADGNNMTTAFFTNAEGGGIQSGNTDGFSALNLQPEGGALNYGGEEIATREWVQDNDYLTSETDPVFTASVPDQVMYKGIIPGSVNLNTYTETGKFFQSSNANASSGTNYPIGIAGMLEIINGADEMIFQTYHAYQANTSYWIRSYYAGTWSPWVRLISSAEALTHGVNYNSATFMGVAQNSLLYHFGNEVDAPIASTGYSINGSVGGVSSVQLFVATGAATGYNPDGFFWRGNNSGGPGWPGPWRQVASREWANTALLQNQNSSAQSADYWISGTGRAVKIGVNTAPSTDAQFQVSGKTFLNGGLDVGDTAYYDNDVALSVKSGKAYLLNIYDSAASPKMTLLQNGNMGIGTNAPAEKLQVAGSIRQSGVTSSLLKANADGKIVAAVAGTDYQDATIDSGMYTPTVSGLKGNVAGVSGKCLYSRCGDIVTVSGTMEVTLGSGSGAGGFELSLPLASTLSFPEDCSGVGSAPVQYVFDIGVEPSLTNQTAAVNFIRTAATGTTKVNIMYQYKIN